MLDRGELSGVPSSKVPGRLHPPMHLFTSDSLRDSLLADPVAWADTVAIERRCCRAPGLVDSGSHIILAARRPVR
jgi:hypothetical protein